MERGGVRESAGNYDMLYSTNPLYLVNDRIETNFSSVLGLGYGSHRIRG